MRIRHLALALLGIGATIVAVQAITGGPGAATQVLDDGTINVTASRDGRGAWVPYTLTVRNLGDRDFTGRLLLQKRVALPALPAAQVHVSGLGTFVSPVRPGGEAAPPDAAYQFPVALSGRHKQSYSFFAPDDFASVIVQDPLGRQVAEGVIDPRASVAVGALTDSPTLATELEAIRVGELTLRVTQWGQAEPFPRRAVLLSGYSMVVLDRYDSGRLSPEQVAALSDFVGLGGELVLAGGADLGRTVRALPRQLVPFTPDGTAFPESLAPVADLSRLVTEAVAPVALGSLGPGGTAILESADGRPLEAEAGYGSGHVVELLFDPDSAAAGGAAPGSAGILALTQAVGRGLEAIPGAKPAGHTLLDASQLPEVLFPRPADVPFPPLWLVGGLLVAYLVVVMPLNYVALRRLGAPTLFWATAPALAIVFSLFCYGVGQGLQAGIRDSEIQLYRVGPNGAASRVDVHGLVFTNGGDHQLTFGKDPLVAPFTVTFPGLTPACAGCLFPGGPGQSTLEEHALDGPPPVIAERGLVYGSVRVVGSADTGHGLLDLTTHLGSVDDRITGTITNSGRASISGLLVYSYYGGEFRAGLIAPGLAPGETVQVDLLPNQRVGDAAPQVPAGAVLTAGQQISLVADEAGRRTLTHAGELALVGFVKPVDSRLAVDGVAPGGRVMAVFGMPVTLESASGRLGEVAVPRLAGFYPDQASGLFLDTYDIAIPATSGPLVLRYDKRLYSDVEVYDWKAHAWLAGPYAQDPASQLVMVAQLNPSEVGPGLVRVRLHEISLTWGSEITVRFPGESP